MSTEPTVPVTDAELVKWTKDAAVFCVGTTKSPVVYRLAKHLLRLAGEVRRLRAELAKAERFGQDAVLKVARLNGKALPDTTWD